MIQGQGQPLRSPKGQNFEKTTNFIEKIVKIDFFLPISKKIFMIDFFCLIFSLKIL